MNDQPGTQPSFATGHCAFSEAPASADRLKSDVLARLRLDRIEALQVQLHTAQTELDVTKSEVELLRAELFDLRCELQDRASVAGPPKPFVQPPLGDPHWLTFGEVCEATDPEKSIVSPLRSGGE